MPLEKVRKVLKIAKEPISLETPIGDEEDSHLGDFIEDKNAVIPVDAAIQANLKETVTRVLASLTPREERVLRMRFGIGMNTDHTLEEVGQQFSVTRERIRQIEAEASEPVSEDAVVPRPVTRLLAAAMFMLVAASGAPCLAQNAPAPAATEPDPRNLALATEILDISYPPERRVALSERRIDALLAQIRAASLQVTGETPDAEAQHIYDRYVARVRSVGGRILAERSPATWAAYARAYARKFTYDELVQARAFAGTPAGTRFLQGIGDISSDPDIVRASTATLTATMAALQPLEDAFEEEVRAYRASHPRR
jgi:hypothetical protein